MKRLESNVTRSKAIKTFMMTLMRLLIDNLTFEAVKLIYMKLSEAVIMKCHKSNEF